MIGSNTFPTYAQLPIPLTGLVYDRGSAPASYTNRNLRYPCFLPQSI